MNVTYFYVALVIGMFISLLVEETIGISAGGMIVPGYMSLVCDSLSQMLLIFAVALLIYFIVNYILPHFVIIFGKRRFVATLMIGVILKLLLELLLFPNLSYFAAIEFSGIGIITPSLIANGCVKQGFKYTIPAVLIETYIVYIIVNVLVFLF